jgi:hypothetical protein
MDRATKAQATRVATPFHQDHTKTTMAKQKSAKKGTLVWVEPPIKPLVIMDSTPPKKDLLHASNAHPAPMPTRLAPLIVKSAMMIPTNLNPMLQVVN